MNPTEQRKQEERADATHGPNGETLARISRPNAPTGLSPSAASRQQRRTSYSALELLQEHFEDLEWIIEGLLPVGLAFLAGRPKTRKSWMALQMAQAVALGGQFLGGRAQQGNVVYLALEDSARRLQRRLQKQGASGAQLASIHFATRWNPLDGDGIVPLETMLDERLANLLVVDTLSRALMSRTDQMEIGRLTEVLGRLQNLAHDRSMCILVIDHHAKAQSQWENPIDDLIGSTGKGAVCDTAWGLYRRKTNPHWATLAVAGRDIEEQDLTIVWDDSVSSWRKSEENDDPLPSSQRAVLDTLLGFGAPAKTPAIAERVGMDRTWVNRSLNALHVSGFVEKTGGRGQEVTWAPRGTSTPSTVGTGAARIEDGET